LTSLKSGFTHSIQTVHNTMGYTVCAGSLTSYDRSCVRPHVRMWFQRMAAKIIVANLFPRGFIFEWIQHGIIALSLHRFSCKISWG
jgi:hypothetical protein